MSDVMKTWELIRCLGKGIPVREYAWSKSPQACLRHIREAREKGRKGKRPRGDTRFCRVL